MPPQCWDHPEELHYYVWLSWSDSFLWCRSAPPGNNACALCSARPTNSFLGEQLKYSSTKHPIWGCSRTLHPPQPSQKNSHCLCKHTSHTGVCLYPREAKKEMEFNTTLFLHGNYQTRCGPAGVYYCSSTEVNGAIGTDVS
uniref:Uncharacterized protein n=1 Tax=Pelusios castaneus TaxID=367368 RepID=A0A8C8SAC8_9SAUR